MRNSKGFTLIELMVGMVILAVAIAGALSFFIFQSTRGHESFREKNTDEGVFSALAVMSRDIHSAGLGVVSAYPKLALLVNRGTGTNPLPDELYLSFNEYMDIQTHDMDRSVNAFTFLRAASIWCDNPELYCRDVSEGPGYQGFVKLIDTSTLRLYGIPARSDKKWNANVGAVLIDVNPTGGEAQACDVNVKGSTGVDNPSLQGAQDWTFPIQASGVALAPGMTAVPAVSYKVRYYYPDGTPYSSSSKPPSYDSGRGVVYGSLWRNRGPDGNAYGVPILGWSPQGGNPLISIRNFQVRRQFKDGGWDVVKNPGETTETSPDPKNVRMLEISLTYQTNIAKDTEQTGTNAPKATWSNEVTRVMRVSPRHLALLGS